MKSVLLAAPLRYLVAVSQPLAPPSEGQEVGGIRGLANH
jgi:hypothetical protein